MTDSFAFSSSHPFHVSVTAAPAAVTHEPIAGAHRRCRIHGGGLVGGDRVITIRRMASVQIDLARRKKGPVSMGAHIRWADVAVDEAEEAESAVLRFGDAVMAAIEDHTISPFEHRQLTVLRAEATTEVREAVQATERTTIAELLAESAKTVKVFNPHILGRAEDAGMLIVPLEWRRKRKAMQFAATPRLSLVESTDPPTAA